MQNSDKPSVDGITHTVSGTSAASGALALSGTADSGGAHTHTVSGTSGSSGTGGSHNNIQPSIVLNYIIKT